MRLLWLIAAILIAASLVAFFVSDDSKISMILLIVGVGASLIDQYRERRR